jgi:hypothetical protein
MSNGNPNPPTPVAPPLVPTAFFRCDLTWNTPSFMTTPYLVTFNTPEEALVYQNIVGGMIAEVIHAAGIEASKFSAGIDPEAAGLRRLEAEVRAASKPYLG